VENSTHEYAREGSVLWLTGLSGAGKSTLATALGKSLKERGERVTVLDGDVLRQGLCKDLGFSQADRTENLRRASEVAKLLADEGFIVITAFISPLASQRAMARECIGEDRFKEVFVDCPLEVCESRDPKGLYKKARQGELPEFTGITSPFEPPIKPDIHLRTDSASIEETVQRLNTLLPPRDPGRVH
jgi:adenylyl-sulfate kinase